MSATTTFSSAHRLYVKSLYRRYLKNTLDWTIRRDVWRGQALQIRAEFDANRNVSDPRALAEILRKAEERLADIKHPDPYITPTAPGGTKWERNLPPSMAPLYDHEAHGAAH
ncbi:NDUFB9, NADH-ubiquinone oxidoreductase [Crepidotus variabilis]|uniref:NADH dehydrogenase [ubiquinone] 1 beta subcomplex subunit 9 n=1 Tax=Crepidotus variabilis TaxID=179855 RepID=A0A9P6EFN3_9AGAR|nr:NDUFB9, NADH-ubiquinone oxidoreductase [Crepidotus variabilis]